MKIMSASTSTLSNSDIIAFAAVAVAILAFFATAWQAYLAWQHNRLSVRPVIEVFKHLGIDRNIHIVVKNMGVGVAIINSVHIINNNKTAYLNLIAIQDLARRYLVNFPPHMVCTIEPCTALAAGESLTLLEFFETEGEGEYRDNVLRMLHDSRIHIQYECIYKTKHGSTTVFS